eukprot:scaffold3947_cov179-Amphora_coffeaeformis.AAC.9
MALTVGDTTSSWGPKVASSPKGKAYNSPESPKGVVVVVKLVLVESTSLSSPKRSLAKTLQAWVTKLLNKAA